MIKIDRMGVGDAMRALTGELIRNHLVTEKQLQLAKMYCNSSRDSITEALIELGFLKKKLFLEMASRVYAFDLEEVKEEMIEPDATDCIPYELAKKYHVFPICKNGEGLIVETYEPFDLAMLDDLRILTGYRIKPRYGSKGQISKHIEKYYHPEKLCSDLLDDVINQAEVEVLRDSETRDKNIDVENLYGNDSSLILLVNKILGAAVHGRASDIHIEPQTKFVQVRFRIDGYLRNMMVIPNRLRSSVAARVKILAEMDIAENRKPQDGRAAVMIYGRKIDLRISATPTFFGEKIVIRILDRQEALLNLPQLGLPDFEYQTMTKTICRPQGMILLVGPTGCGKTSSLYAALNYIKQRNVDNIITIEDPIEYQIDGINQMQVNPAKNVTFDNALRSILRQDPNVILVGEIRDRETADIAFRSSLTGHLVFSTLHTRSAVAAITRVRDIGLEPYLIASSLLMIVAQRLVRVTCPYCRVQYEPRTSLLDKFEDYIKRLKIEEFYKGRGCEHCGMTGYKGRTAIFEMLQFDNKMRQLVTEGASEDRIYVEARKNGLKSLAESGVEKVASGLTTLEEVNRIADVMDIDFCSPLLDK